MSDSDNQNISAQDYDDAVEATPTDASLANSTGTADEVGSHDGWVGEDGPRRGKSPRVVAAQYPPATREALLAELPPRPATVGPIFVPHSLELSSSQPSASSGEELDPLNSEDVRNHPCLLTLSELEETTALLTGRVEFQTRRSLGNGLEEPHSVSEVSLEVTHASSLVRSLHETHKYPAATRALKNAVVKISAEAYEYWVFRSPESVAATDLEPLDYSQPEKYVPKKMTCSSMADPTAETAKRGMVLERSFAPAPTGPKKPRPKVTLGGRKAPLPTDVPPAQGAVPTLPAGSTGTAPAADLQVARPTTRRGKEKTTDQEVEEIPPPKKQKRPIARGSTPVLDVLREGGEHTASFIDKVRAVIPTREAIRDLDTDQVGEMIAQSVLWLSHMTNDLFCRAKAAENVTRRQTDVLPPLPPTVPGPNALAGQKRSFAEGTRTLRPRLPPCEFPRGPETALRGRGKELNVAVQIAHAGAPNSRGSGRPPASGSAQVGNPHGVHGILVRRLSNDLRENWDLMDHIDWLLRWGLDRMCPIRSHAGIEVGPEVLVAGTMVVGVLHLILWGGSKGGLLSSGMEHTWGACTVDQYRSRTAVHVSGRRKAVGGRASPGRTLWSGCEVQVGSVTVPAQTHWTVRTASSDGQASSPAAFVDLFSPAASS
nr:uncharacterized protein LOC109184184 [Ipomoea batatas]